jgi:dephospho-CoA kinase
MGIPVVGLTGGIASGKSTVARSFAALGVPVIDADLLAREVVLPGSDGLAEIVRTFGAGVLLADGSLDRKGLGAIVFSDGAARAKLNAITHPRIAGLTAQRLAALAAANHTYALYEAALIVENGMHRGMRGLVVVRADEATQLARLIQRDGMSEVDARARIAAQSSLDEKLKVADFVIDNSGDVSLLHGHVSDVHEQILARVKGA